jgi:hypothetical protein
LKRDEEEVEGRVFFSLLVEWILLEGTVKKSCKLFKAALRSPPEQSAISWISLGEGLEAVEMEWLIRVSIFFMSVLLTGRSLTRQAAGCWRMSTGSKVWTFIPRSSPLFAPKEYMGRPARESSSPFSPGVTVVSEIMMTRGGVDGR